MASVPTVPFAREMFVQTAREFLLLPLWWYTSGLSTVFVWVRETMQSIVRSFGLGIWMKHLFVPMYGDTTFVGRFISFGIRLAVIVGKSIAVGILAFLLSGLFIVYLLVLPVLTIFFLIQAIGVIAG